jgi:hypothetical protein
MTAVFVHLRKAQTEEKTLVGKHFAFIAIGAFVSKNMVETLEHDVILGKDNNKKTRSVSNGLLII